ncbi:carboxypeptidase-like regulatory domain-containing protein [Nocardioides bruguierae]|uniref:Carboxypeptidase-like regulatory domain-containing protein n=1 Tax=Nocardioides bruguierae TaxID=2945102 RepID=A0A9X2IE35_9ACTN|nr:carboxypeptidase-like regulatory domain-containing protein [Nocardioides bruguierae]MCM0619867.1 carboxypeptidase-like regulatory domain-containing protein [Nocardioides bruguierae]
MVELHRAAPCLARLRWFAGDRLVGERRSWDARVVLPVEPGPVTVEVVDDRDGTDPLRLASVRVQLVVTGTDDEPAPVPVELARGSRLVGRVTAADGGLVRFARVTARASDGRTFAVRTDGLGRYVLGGLPAVPLLVRATHRTGRSVSTALTPGVGRLHLHAPVLTLPPLAPEPTDTPITAGGAFRGRVLAAGEQADGGRGVWAARVELRDAAGAVLARTRTDASGAFRVGGDLPSSSGLVLTVSSGPVRPVAGAHPTRTTVRGLSCGPAEVVELGSLTLPRTATTEQDAAAGGLLPRAAALRLPSVRA